MPIYEYECEQCGVRFEKTAAHDRSTLTDCPECGGHVHRVMQPVGVIFKGSGFYVTDNKGRSSTGIPARRRTRRPSPQRRSESTAAPAAASSSDKDNKSS